MAYEKKTYKKETTKKRNQESTEVRTARSADLGKYGDTDTRKFENPLKPLMTETEKANAQVLELSYDFSCRIIRLYKYLNEGKRVRRIGILLMRWEDSC